MKGRICKLLIPENYKPCKYYIKTGLCSRDDMFRCTEYISRFEPTLSYSAVNHFMRCPQQYYLSNIKGLQLGEEYHSDALKIGTHVDSALTVSPEIGVAEKDRNKIWAAKVQAILTAFNNLFPDVLVCYTGQKEFYWHEDRYPQVHGFIDLSEADHFIELKCTSRPEFYTNLYWIHDQMGTYFLSNPNYEYGIIWVVRVPQLKQIGNFRDESLRGLYRIGVSRDMLETSGLLFHSGYNKDTESIWC